MQVLYPYYVFFLKNKRKKNESKATLTDVWLYLKI